jgi:hypothetical protein
MLALVSFSCDDQWPPSQFTRLGGAHSLDAIPEAGKAIVAQQRSWVKP